MKTIKNRSRLVNLMRALMIIFFLSVSHDVYSQDRQVRIPGAEKPVNTPPKKNKTQPVRTPVNTAPTPRLTFDKTTKTLNYDGWQYQFMVVEGSKFMMGSVPGKPEVSAVGTKAHKVNLETYAIGNIEVPRWLWKAVMGNDPFTVGIIEDDDMGAPVNNVSWNDCQTFVSKLNKIIGITFALPTEAQWEFAARGGVNDDKTTYSGTNDKLKLPVAANSLGIYSMSGLLKEWCADWYGDWDADGEINEACVLNPKGSDAGQTKVVRGGSNTDYSQMEVTSRERYSPSEKSGDIGLRLVLQMVK